MNALPVEDDMPVVELLSLSEEDHDVDSADTENISSVSTHSREHGRKNGTLVKLMAIVAVAGLLAGAIFGSGFFLFSHSTAHQSSTVASKTTPMPSRTTSQPTSIPTSAPTVSPSPVRTATPSPSPTVLPSPTASAANYPRIAGAYNGTILDRYTMPSVSTSMSLNQVRQQGASISGNFSVGPALIGNGPFNGTVSADKIQFTVARYADFLPLLFQGTIQPDGSISGTYCSALNNQCDYSAGGYGNWNVSPVVLGS
jgi:eukaryotic-like serine/threonine-protein kinase